MVDSMRDSMPFIESLAILHVSASALTRHGHRYWVEASSHLQTHWWVAYPVRGERGGAGVGWGVGWGSLRRSYFKEGLF